MAADSSGTGTNPTEIVTDPVGTINTVQAWFSENGLELGKNILIGLIIIVVGKMLIDLLATILMKALKRSQKVNKLAAKFIVDISRKVAWVFVWILVAGVFIDVTPLITGLGVGGFIIGFAFQDSLSNFAAGFMILLNSPFKEGDYVEVAGNAGSVVNINLMATTLNTPDNKRITVPNSGVWGQPIVNYTANDTRRVDMTAGISYGADIGKAQKIILDIFKKDKRILDDPAPTIEVVEMADSSVNLVVRPWVKTGDYWPVYFATQKAIKENFDKNGIEIPFPQMVIHRGDHEEESA